MINQVQDLSFIKLIVDVLKCFGIAVKMLFVKFLI